LKVALGTLKDKGEALAMFLEPRVGAKPSVAADAIEIDDSSVREGVHPRQVKTYIKRFLYMNGVRKNYRVFVSGKELTIQEIELGKEEEEEKGKAVKEELEKAEAKEEETEAPAEVPMEEKGEEPPAPEEAKPEKPKRGSRRPRPRKKKEE
jgi:hypothetical protein